MKILFVCRSNAGRSQIAMELYNRIHPGEAESAGTHVDMAGQEIIDRPTAASAIAAMKEIGINMSHNKRRQLTPEMLDDFDHIVVLAETKSIPGYLNSWPAAEMWHIEDTRYDNDKRAGIVRDELNKRVIELAKRLHP